MKDIREKQLAEVEFRKKEIMEKYGVDEKVFNIIKKYRKDDFYKDIIENFEKEYHSIVYMVVSDVFGKIIGFLYVSEHIDEWENERPSVYPDEAMYIYNEIFDIKEFGWCQIKNIEGKLKLQI